MIDQHRAQLDDLMRRRMPVHAGRIAKDHYQDNFRKSGYVNGGLKPWQKSKRQKSGSKSAGDNYGTLLSGRNHLFSSIQYTPGDGRVRVFNDVPYATTHNFGQTLHPKVTSAMRKFAWAKYFESAGITQGMDKAQKKERAESAGDDSNMWKRLALTKKTKLTIKMPKRPFLGESKELNDKIKAKGELEIDKILNS